jgi:large subunit ribosomal protein L21
VSDDQGARVGNPVLAGASVTAKVKSHGRADKIKVFKMRRRKHYRKTQGHRQYYTELEITAIK